MITTAARTTAVRTIEHPAGRVAAGVGAFVFALAAFVWLVFWLCMTLPLHVALVLVGGRGFVQPGGDYVVPWWAMLLVTLVCAAPLVI